MAVAAEDIYGAKIRKGSWRDRCTCFVYVLAANIALGIAVGLIVKLTGWTPSGGDASGGSGGLLSYFRRGSSASGAKNWPDLCPKLRTTYEGNWTTDEVGVYAVGQIRIIKRKDDKNRLLLIPYASYCRNDKLCPVSGVSAYYSNTLQKKWTQNPRSNGDISTFTCDIDLDNDGVMDCALVTNDPAEVNLISGEDGKILLHWEAEDKGWSTYPPLTVPDINADGIPEVLLALTRTNSRNGVKDTIFRIYESTKDDRAGGIKFITPDKHYERDRLVIKNTTLSSRVYIWEVGDAHPQLVIPFVEQKGLVSLDFNDYLRGDYDNGVLLFKEYVLGPPSFADLNGDGLVDLVACRLEKQRDAVGFSLIALDRSKYSKSSGQGGLLWEYKLKDHSCLLNSVSFARRKSSLPIVVAYFQTNQSPTSSKMVLINGKTGRSEWEGTIENNGYTPEYAPLSIRVSDKSHSSDVILSWNQSFSRLDLIARKVRHAHVNSTHLYQHRAYGTDDVVTISRGLINDRKQLKTASELLNLRFTGGFEVNKDGVGELFFITNNLTTTYYSGDMITSWCLMIHRIKLECDCGNDKDGATKKDTKGEGKKCAGKLAVDQPWSAYRGTDGLAVYA